LLRISRRNLTGAIEGPDVSENATEVICGKTLEEESGDFVAVQLEVVRAVIESTTVSSPRSGSPGIAFALLEDHDLMVGFGEAESRGKPREAGPDNGDSRHMR
jgi:hypothetical protein